jgi:Ca2+-binding RTX toxin-like protein
LGDNVENLTALSGQSGAIYLTGNALANRILGNEADNVINGGTGADVMEGGAGNDTYVVDDAGDVVSDSSGSDTVHTFINYTVGSSVDALRALGSAGLALIGNAFANTIYGNEAKNAIKGGSGDDTLSGGYGNDTLYGQSGKDVFVFDTRLSRYGNVDKIADFSVNTTPSGSRMRSLPSSRQASSSLPPSGRGRRRTTRMTASSTTARRATSTTMPTAPAPRPSRC